MKIVVIISANSEWRAVKEMFPNLEIFHFPFGEYAELTLNPSTLLRASVKRLTLFQGGWGKISAAASAQYVIDHFHPDLLINLGTCGGFAGRIKTGTVILVERTLVYDIVEQMGNSAEAIEHYAVDIDLTWLMDDGKWIMDNGNVVRGLLVSADRDIVAEDIPRLVEKYDAVAADWESGAIAWVAKKNGTRLLILRAVTDLVGGDGGEAYGNLELFHERAKGVMKKLFNQLPDWLAHIQ